MKRRIVSRSCKASIPFPIVSELSEPLIYGPLPVEARFLLALMAAHVGKRDQAKQLIEGIRPAFGGRLPTMAGVAAVLAMIGETSEAEQIARSFHLLSLGTAISRCRQAFLSIAMGDREGAISFLKLAVEDQEAELVWIGVDPRFDSIRQAPAFQALANKVIPRSAELWKTDS
jgi:hypothetical protein